MTERRRGGVARCNARHGEEGCGPVRRTRVADRSMRICLVYDCLFPYTVGGAERWYRNLGERLAADGHDVTYLTLRQWDRGEQREICRACAWSPPARGWRSTAPTGRAGSLPPLVFGAGVLWHLLRHGRRYDVVHTASFPYFSLLAAGARAAAAPLPAGRRLARAVERATTGASTSAASAGAIGACGAGGCACACRSARSASRELTARRLRDERRARRASTVLEGEYAGLARRRRRRCPPSRSSSSPGRHIPEKRAPARRARGRAARASASRGCAARSSATARSAPRCSRRSPSTALEDVVEAPGLRAPPRSVERDLAPRALPGAAVAARGLRPGGRRGGRARARRASSCATPTTPRPSSSSEGVNGFVAPSTRRPRTSPTRSCACTRRARALRAATARVVRAPTRSGSRSTPRSTSVAAELRRSARS